MFFFVLGFNLGLTLLNCFLAWKLWRLLPVLVRVTNTLTRVERRLHRIFYPAPEFLLVGRAGTRCLRQSYQRLYRQIQGIGPIFWTLSLVIRYWQRQARRGRADDRFIIKTKALFSRSLP